MSAEARPAPELPEELVIAFWHGDLGRTATLLSAAARDGLRGPVITAAVHHLRARQQP